MVMRAGRERDPLMVRISLPEQVRLSVCVCVCGCVCVRVRGVGGGVHVLMAPTQDRRWGQGCGQGKDSYREGSNQDMF